MTEPIAAAITREMIFDIAILLWTNSVQLKVFHLFSLGFLIVKEEHAPRSHSAAWHRNSSDGFTAVPRRSSPGPEGQVQDSFAVPAFIKKNALRRSNEATGGSHWWPGSEIPLGSGPLL